VAVVEPVLAGEALSFDDGCSACDELVAEIGDPLIRLGLFRRGMAAVSRRDRSKSDELGEFGDGLHHGTALRAEIAEGLVRLSRRMEARFAGLALVVGHHAAPQVFT
jgi:hypothetical protein